MMLLAFPAQAAVPSYGPSACPPLPEPQVIVSSYFEEPNINTQHTMIALRDIASRQPASVLQKEQPVGLAIGELSIGMTLQSSLIVGSDGQVCARIRQLQLDAGFQRNTIYVASELPRRSCSYNEVLEHEQGHIQIDRLMLQKFKPLLTQFADSAVRNMGVVRASSPAEAERKMQMFLNEQLDTASEAMRKERTRLQAEHDSVEEYARMGKVCDGAIAQAVAQYGYQTAQKTSLGMNAARLPAPTRTPARQPFTRY